MATQKESDAIIRRHVQSLRFGGGLVNKTLRAFLNMESVKNIITASYKVPARRKEALVKELKKQYKGMKKEIFESLQEYVELDVDWFNHVFKSDVNIKKKSAALITYSVNSVFPEANSTPQYMLDRAFDSAGEQAGFISDKVAAGLTSTAEAASAITALFNQLQRNCNVAVRTMTMAVANNARHEMYAALGSIRGYIIAAVLDGSTSPYCRLADSKYYDTGKGPVPPFHPQCRTTTIPVMHGESDDDAREMLDYRPRIEPGESYGKGDNTLKNDKRHREKGRISVKPSAHKRGSSTTYSEFLGSQTRTTQGKAFIRDVLGTTKGNTFIRDIAEGLDPHAALGKNYDQFGKELSLKELKRRKRL